jgi:hypothetical protein
MSPSSLVAKTEHFESTNSKNLTVGGPLDTGDHMVIRQTAVKLATILVPNTVFGILTT